MKNSLVLLISICSLALFSACGGGSTPPPLVATHFSVTTTATPVAGAAFNFTVTALSASGQTATSYSGTVHFTSTDGQAVLPANSTLINGTGTFSVTMKTVGSQTITSTDSVTASITGTSNSINVTGASAKQLSVTAPANATSGTTFTFTVTALDGSNNVATSYSGTVHFTSADVQANLPANSTLMNGTGTFSAVLKTVGSQTITATDTVAPAVTGTSKTINVSGATATNPVPFINQPLNPDAAIPGGAAFALKVNGTGFVPGATVKWNGGTRVTSFVNESQVTAAVLASDIATFNTASITVVNPAPGGGTSNATFFESTRPTSSVAWSSASNLTPGTAPSSVATGDLNGDGRLDLIVANGGSNNISIFLNNGDGTFRAAVNYPAGTKPTSVGLGDFNGDGKLDLAVANGDGNNISIFLNNGDGTFHAAVNYPTGTNPDSVAVADFNGDGKLDLVVANSGSSNVSVLLGNGDGTFHAAVDFGAGSNPSSVAVGDFDGDGKLDLVVANGIEDNVSILLGVGDGTFQAAVNFLAGSDSSFVVVGDFNGDGKLDLAVANSGLGNFADGTVSILLGNGNGSFQPAVNYSTGFTSSAVVLGDFNGDGKLDLAVLNPDKTGAGKSSISILLGNGDGTFQPKADSPDGSKTSSLTAGDFNNDGRLDLAVADSDSSTVSVTLQPGLVSGPGALLSSTSLNFATQLVGTTSSPQPVQLTNYGSTMLSIAGIAVTANFGETDNCGSSLAAGAGCTINVTFKPGGINSVLGTLSVTDNAPGSPQTASLNGAGTEVNLVPSFMNFLCTQTCPPGPKTATLTNAGATALTISSITITSPLVGPSRHAFAETNNCPTSLGAGLSCSITVTFNGAFNTFYKGTLIVTDNGGESPQTVPLTGIIE